MTVRDTKRSTGRRLRTALAAACASGLLMAGPAALATATAARAASSSATSGTTLRVAMDSSGVDTLNPFTAFFNGSLDIFGSIYPSLTTIDENGVPAPYLATSWTLSPDHLTWTFKIRSGLTWSDGQPLTAADAAWTLNLIMTNSVAGTANGTLVSNFASVTAPDPTTLVIRTKQPEANVTYVSIPISGIPIVPQHIWQSHVAGLSTYKNDTFPVVGYGPWVLTDYQTDQYAKFDADKSFVLGAPKYDHLIEQLYKESDAAVAALKAGQLDYINGVDATQFSSLQHADGVRTAQAAGEGWTGVELNPGAKTRSGKPIGTGNPALADPTLRRAIAEAVDKKTLLAKVIDGQGQVAAGYLPPAWPQWNWTPPAGQGQPYDPAAANKMLDAAGYTMGPNGVRIDPKTGKPLDLRLGIHSGRAEDAAISTYLAGWLKAIGINVDIQPMSMSALNSNLGKGDWDMLMDSWTTGPDPTYLLGIQTCATLPDDNGNGGNTDSFYCNPAYDKLFGQQATVFDATQRAQVVGQMQGILYNADVDQLLYYATDKIAASSNVTGLVTGTQTNGYYPAQTTFWSYLKAAPAAQSASASSGSGSTGLWLGLVGIVVVVGAGTVVVRRRAGADDRE
ncbi:ABC transporter substrate-binding protein [Streptacidiphilus fuscans]|uniref:ABC transporter substrate-binding protein n=1 Tax=Streptacidiphilus fuscans TaxID=2789292 RepID=A0A931B4T7_9ACTN|nr:ABC transporter substrate-binding protein [Streptacidiphilus fuscans]MBF9066915.1 ABC transporter substrate-binding protein [Streptacidiphilus fuscans]